MNTLDLVKNVAIEEPGADNTVHASERIWLRLYSKFVCASVLFLIFAGSLVTSHEAGLAVPDWPTTYGQNMFLFPYSDWRGNIFYEHSHRLIASMVGFLTVILTVWIALVEKRRWVRLLSFAALGAVIFQGILGGLTVLFYLPAPVSISHAMLAQTFFVITIVLAYSQSQELSRACREGLLGDSRLFRVAVTGVAALYLQLFLGALMRHTKSGLAIPDFPTMAGKYLPTFNSAMQAKINDMLFSHGLDPVSLTQICIHFAHRIGAVLVILAVIWIFISTEFRGRIATRTLRIARSISLLCIVQFALGIYAVLSLKAPYITSVHVTCGALLLGLMVLFALRAWCLRPEPGH